jgi:hypothetical protein
MKVIHKQIYKRGMFGGVSNTTLCGRVRNGGDYNVAEPGEQVTCLFCLKLIAAKGEPEDGKHLLRETESDRKD